MKNNPFTRFLSVALTAAMLVGVMPGAVLADAGEAIVGASSAVVESIPESTTPADAAPVATEVPPVIEPEATPEAAQPEASPEAEATPEVTQQPEATPEATEQPEATPEATQEPEATPEATEQPEATPETTQEPEATPEATEKPETTPEATEEPETSPEPTEEPVELNKEAYIETAEVAEGVTVTVKVPANTLPEDVNLVAEMLAEDTQAHADAEAALADAEVQYDGMIAMDIRFEDAEGNEVEPANEVEVSIDAQALLPEDADPETVAVQHLKEDETGAVTVETVADAAPATGDVTVAENAEQPALNMASTFAVEGFSTFTIIWGRSSITVRYVTPDNKEISVEGAPSDYILARDVDLEQYKTLAENEGYRVSDVSYIYNRNQVTGIQNVRYASSKLQYTTDGRNWSSFVSGGTLYIVCVEPVATVDSYGEGVKLYLFDFELGTTGEMGVDSSYEDGSRKTELVQSTLGEDGFPKNKSGVSLAKWFDPKKNNSAIAANHLFLQSEYDASKYFYYSGSDNFASIVNGEQYPYADGTWLTDFTVCNQLASPSTEDAFFYQRGNFLPFNTLTNKVVNHNLYDYLGKKLEWSDSRYNENLYGVNGNVNYYFGMYMTADFIMPKDGQVNGEDMVFEFTGDDDLWVFIDGKLILDLGGKHDALTGTINFATGEVVEYDTAKNDGSGTTPSKIWDKLNIFEEQYYSDVFKPYTQHTIKMFYMESGAGASNLRIKFNLPTVPNNSLDVTKQLQSTENADLDKYLQQTMTYRFQVWNADGNSLRVNKGDTYVVLENGVQVGGTRTVGENGIFTLKAGQTARFNGMFPANSSEYFVRELIPQDASGQYEDIVYEVHNDGGDTQIKDEDGIVIGEIRFNGYDTAPITPADGSASVVYTNKVSMDTKDWSILKIAKTLEGNETPVPGDTFIMNVKLNDVPLAVGTSYTVGDETKTVQTAGQIVLEAGQTASLLLLADVNFKVTEDTLPGDQEYSFRSYQYGGETKTVQADGIGGYIAGAGTYEVTVTNRRLKGDLVINKTIVNSAGLTEQELDRIKSGLKFKVTDQNGSPVTTDDNRTGEYAPTGWTKQPDGNITASIVLHNLPAGQYTVEEIITDGSMPTSVQRTTTVSVNDGTSKEAMSANGDLAGGYDVVTFNFTNTYEAAEGYLEIEKELKQFDKDGELIRFDGFGGGKDLFSFRIEATTGEAMGKVWYMYVDGNGDAYYAVNGTTKQTTLTLPAGEYIITELDNVNYKFEDVSALKNGKNEGETEGITNGITVTVDGSETTVVTFTNTAKDDDIPTDGSGVINQFSKKDGVITITPVIVAEGDKVNDEDHGVTTSRKNGASE